MLERIIKIKHLARFRDYSARGDVSMRKLVLIYGENGQGKTTLCALLRSLQSGSTDALLARKTLGQNGNPEVDLRADGQSITLRNQRWSATLPQLTIFDAEFVHENIYAADRVDHTHKKNTYRIIVGARGVELARRIDELTTAIRDATTELTRAREGVQGHARGAASIESFLAIPETENIDALLATKEAELAAAERSLQQREQIRQQPPLALVAMPEWPEAIDYVLPRTLEQISREAEARLKAHVQTHLDTQGETWLAKGTQYLRGPGCPFCGQDLAGSNLVGSYRAYFNEDYRRLRDEVGGLQRHLEATFGDAVVTTIAARAERNAELALFWGQFCDARLPELSERAVRELAQQARQLYADAIAAKTAAPLEPVALPAIIGELRGTWARIAEAVAAYNDRVRHINAEVTRLKASPAGQDADRIRRELTQLKQSQLRHQPAVAAACQAFQTATAAKARLEEEKEAARAALDAYCTEVLRDHQEQINRYLEQFNTGFRITNTRHNYVGGTPNSSFQIQINNVGVELGDERTPATAPSFKTALSAGDRSALALAFFLASLRRDPNLAQRIVVLDDPFSSQDRFRRSSTQYLITRLAGEVAQVIVLSHDAQFVQGLIREAGDTPRSCLQVTAAGESVALAACDIDAILGCRLGRDRAKLSAFVARGEGELLDVARAIRPVVESHMRQGVPGGFAGRDTLGAMVEAIRAAAPEAPEASFLPLVDDLDQINRYARNFHHPPDQPAPAVVIDAAELRGTAQRALRLVGGI